MHPECKLCSACGELKPLSAYTPRPGSRDGYRAQCRDCRRLRDYPWRVAHRDYLLSYGVEYRRDHPEIHAAWRASNPEAMRVRKINSSARARGAQTVITIADYRAVVARCQGRCQQCGTTEKIDVDHIIDLRDGGAHHRDNLQLLCRSCNTIKGHQARKARAMRRRQADWA